MSTLERAIEIAAAAHTGQTGHDGSPYVLHPLRVMLLLENRDEKVAGVLHDVVEKSADWTLDRLRAEGFSEKIVGAIDSLTRRPDEDLLDAVKRAKANPIGRIVKWADLTDNMNTIPMKEDDVGATLERYREELLELEV